MTKDDLNQIVTIKDLEVFRERLLTELKSILINKDSPRKGFYTPKEFGYATGMKYSTILHHCSTGKLKARQDNPNCSWSICASEVERFKEEADKNTV